ncbi:MAG: ArsA family ATPase [Intrasporangiaceae bacterium]|nr:ArsA family ATPase [Intrasporangiaceae bacterium]
MTGKGGVGKTSVAAATAVRAAADGSRVLVTSTDPAHSLADVLAEPLVDEPTPIPSIGAPRRSGGELHAQQIDAQARLEQHWGAVRDYLATVLAAGGMEAARAEELVLLPGLDELFALIDLRNRVTSGRYDLIVVDCAPTAETLRLLALPDALRWYADRFLGAGRHLARVARPLRRSGSDASAAVPVPGDNVFDAVEQVHADLAAVHALLQDPKRASVRLVTNPERLVVAEAMRTATSLSLFGYAIDAVIANRVLPLEVADPYLERWHGRHAEHLATLREAFAPLTIRQAPLLRDEPIGVAALLELSEHLYPDGDPARVLHDSVPLQLSSDGDERQLSLVLPFATTDDLEVHRHGEDLHLKVAGVRRRLSLPSSLRSSEVVGARLDGGRLVVRFRWAVSAPVGS